MKFDRAITETVIKHEYGKRETEGGREEGQETGKRTRNTKGGNEHTARGDRKRKKQGREAAK